MNGFSYFSLWDNCSMLSNSFYVSYRAMGATSWSPSPLQVTCIRLYKVIGQQQWEDSMT